MLSQGPKLGSDVDKVDGGLSDVVMIGGVLNFVVVITGGVFEFWHFMELIVKSAQIKTAKNQTWNFISFVSFCYFNY